MSGRAGKTIRGERFLLVSARHVEDLPPVEHHVHADLVLDTSCRGPTGVHQLHVGPGNGPLRLEDIQGARVLSWSFDVREPAFTLDAIRRWQRLEAVPCPGTHFALALCRDSGQALLASDPLGALPVFWTCRPGWVAASNCLELILGLDPALARASALKLLSCWTLSHFVGNDFWTEHVDMFPAATLAEIVRARPRTRQHWDYHALLQRDTPARALDELAEALSDTLADIYQAHPDTRVLLSGGHHSRLVLASAYAAGARPKCLVVGSGRLRDARAAFDVCQHLSLPVDQTTLDLTSDELRERFATMARVQAGVGLWRYNVLGFASVFESRPGLVVAMGTGANCIRATNRQAVDNQRMRVQLTGSGDELRAHWTFYGPGTELFAADTDRLRARLDAFLHDRVNRPNGERDDLPPAGVLGRFFMLNRDRRLYAPERAYLQQHARVVYPLLDQRIVERMCALSARVYNEDLVPWPKLLERLCPACLHVPHQQRFRAPVHTRLLRKAVRLATAGRVTNRPRWFEYRLMAPDERFEPGSTTYDLWCELLDWAKGNPQLGLDPEAMDRAPQQIGKQYKMACNALPWLAYVRYLKDCGISVSMALP